MVRRPLEPSSSLILNVHKLWLEDIVGHLDVIKSELDATEEMARERVKKDKKSIHMLLHKTLEFIGYVKHRLGIRRYHQTNP